MFEVKNGNGLIALTQSELEAIKKTAFDEGFAKAKEEKKTKSKAKVKTSKGEVRNNIVEE